MSYQFTLLDGKKLSNQILDKLAGDIRGLPQAPELHVILVGNNPASEIYVKRKHEAAARIGIVSKIHNLNTTVSESDLLALLRQLNLDPKVTAILVQLPLPERIDKEKVLETIAPEKDADGFHPYNLGRLFAGLASVEPCTPKGIIAMLHEYRIELAGREAVVVGRSNIVGKPLAHLLLRENATVTVCHSRTRDLAAVCRRADILVAAIGRAKIITADYIKPGACVIDVGMNRLDGKLCGDVDFDAVVPVVSAITPVPGGVGPMTIAMLMRNTVDLFLASRG